MDDAKTGGCLDAGGTRLRFDETSVSVSCASTDLTDFDVAMRDVTPFERDGELSLDDFFAQ